MKPLAAILSTLITMSLVTLPASAAIYTDATGDFSPSFGNDGLDISSVSVVNDATTLSFTITTVGAPNAQTWYNYLVGFVTPALPGSGGNANATGGWGTDIQMSVGGMDFFLGAYPGFSGYDFKTWNGSAWTTTSGASSASATQVTFSVPLASLGVSAGDTFKFDVWTQSAGNSVLDALSDSTIRGFQNNPFDTGANALSYTVAVPEPTTGALMGLAALAMFSRAVRRHGR
jgi:hypothetical protein